MVTSREAEFEAMGPYNVPEFNQTNEERRFNELQKVREEFTGLRVAAFQRYKNSRDAAERFIDNFPEHAREAAENGSCVVRCGLHTNYLQDDRKIRKEREEILRAFQNIYGINRYQVAFCSSGRLVGDTVQEINWMDINFL